MKDTSIVLAKVADAIFPLLLLGVCVACSHLLLQAWAEGAVAFGSGRRTFSIERSSSPVLYVGVCLAYTGIAGWAVKTLYVRCRAWASGTKSKFPHWP